MIRKFCKINLPTTLFTIWFLLSTHQLLSQESKCNCIEELNETSELIKNAKSYHIQVKKAHRVAEFEVWKEKIEQEMIHDNWSDFFCSGYLQKYISFIRDHHNQIYFIPKTIVSNIPTYPYPLDTIHINNDGISGIYHAGNDQILVQREQDNLWYGITLKSDSEGWTKGKVRLRINKDSSNNFELYEYFSNGLLFYQKDIKITDGRIHSTFWNKANNYFFNQNHEDDFTYTSIHNSFDYIGIKSLKRTRHFMQAAKSFYDTYLDSLTQEHLIIDLRNNGGGAILQAQPLVRSLKKNKSIKKIYVLINFKTASAAELLALTLKKDPRTILVGENSRGSLEYGYGNQAFSATTSCSKFNIVLSTKRLSKKLSQYECIGITPDYTFDNTTDWIQQILDLNSSEATPKTQQ